MITQHPKDQYVTLFFQENVTLNCTVVSFPASTNIAWFHNGSEVQNVMLSNELLNNYTVTSTAVIPMVGRNTTGMYFCRAILRGYDEYADSNHSMVVVRGKLNIILHFSILNLAQLMKSLIIQLP